MYSTVGGHLPPIFVEHTVTKSHELQPSKRENVNKECSTVEGLTTVRIDVAVNDGSDVQGLKRDLSVMVCVYGSLSRQSVGILTSARVFSNK